MRNRYLTIVLATLLSASSLFAQKNYWDKSKIGVIAGPSIHLFQENNASQLMDYKFTNKASTTFGVQMITKVNKKVAIGYGVVSNRIRFDRTDDCPSCTEVAAQSNHFKYNYISIPVNAQYYFQSDRLDIFGIAGINAQLLTKSKGSYTSPNGQDYNLINLSNNTAKSLFGLEIGAGINYNLSYRGSFGLNVMYQRNLNDFNTTPSITLSSITIQPGLYYQF